MKNVMRIVVLLALVFSMVGCSTMMEILPYRGEIIGDVKTASCNTGVFKTVMFDVMFDFDKDNIRQDQLSVIDDITNFMNANPNVDVAIDAYASEEGPSPYNLNLSQRRADSVKAALIKKGIETDRIHNSVGKGETNIFGNILKINRRAVVVSVQ